MHLLWFAICGLVAGAIARMLHPGKDPMNWLWTMLLGMGGAVIGGYLVGALGIDATHGPIGFAAAVGGAILLLVLYHLATARRTSLDAPAGSSDYKKAVFDDLSKGPNG